ncbi:MAG: hypothetical protein JO339_12650 [Alphaproteobacteria bacterium]|nr:hypothetical protein [Alphaproteobacteria bacterium]
MTLSLAAAIFAFFAANQGPAPTDRQDGSVASTSPASASIVQTAKQSGLDGLWKNVRFGLPRIPRGGW